MSNEIVEFDDAVTANLFAARARIKKAIAITNLLLKEGVLARDLTNIDSDTWNIIARQAGVHPPSDITKVIIEELLRWRLG